MTLAFEDDFVTIHHGDAWDLAPTLEPQSIHAIVTSPPYWGLRDYGTATWIGGDEACDHKFGMLASMKSTLNGGHLYGEHEKVHSNGMPYKDVCGKCGAIREDGQFGLEPTPEAYVARLVALFALLRPALRDDGTVWLNLGDSYAGSGKGQNGDGSSAVVAGSKRATSAGTTTGGLLTSTPDGLKPKDLCGIPWRVAFALQADGWYLRQDIIWHKPNPMPESVTDRCTKAHEYVFLLSKSPRYYYDAEAIKEAAICGDPRKPYAPGQVDARGDGHDRKGGTIRPSVARGGFDGKNHEPGKEAFRSVQDWRNKRSVWTVATTPFSAAHFATFPPALITPCILAGCPEGGTVLDPFMGSGTTAQVARSLGRKSIGFELNAEYIDIAAKHRLSQGVLL